MREAGVGATETLRGGSPAARAEVQRKERSQKDVQSGHPVTELERSVRRRQDSQLVGQVGEDP